MNSGHGDDEMARREKQMSEIKTVGVVDLRRVLREMITEDANESLRDQPGRRDTAADCIERLKGRDGTVSIEDAQEFAPYGFAVVYRNGELTLVSR